MTQNRMTTMQFFFPPCISGPKERCNIYFKFIVLDSIMIVECLFESPVTRVVYIKIGIHITCLSTYQSSILLHFVRDFGIKSKQLTAYIPLIFPSVSNLDYVSSRTQYISRNCIFNPYVISLATNFCKRMVLISCHTEGITNIAIFPAMSENQTCPAHCKGDETSLVCKSITLLFMTNIYHLRELTLSKFYSMLCSIHR